MLLTLAPFGALLPAVAFAAVTLPAPNAGPSDRVSGLLESAVRQLDDALRATGPAMALTVDDVRSHIDLTPFRSRFAGSDKDLAAAFDRAAADLVQVALREASLR
jgi:hypothetical protein